MHAFTRLSLGSILGSLLGSLALISASTASAQVYPPEQVYYHAPQPVPHAVPHHGRPHHRHHPAYVNDLVQIEQRIAHQQQRIYHGTQSGQLTRREARHLQNQQNHIVGYLNAYKADGFFTWPERNSMLSQLDAHGREIYELTHNRWTVGYRHPHGWR